MTLLPLGELICHLSVVGIHLRSAFDLRSRCCEFKAGQDETNASLYCSLKLYVRISVNIM